MIGEVSPRFAETFSCRRNRILGIPLGRRNGKIACRPCEISLQRRRVIPALKPRRIVTHPNAAIPAMPAAVIDRRRVRFLMRLPLLGARTHLEWDVDLTYRLVDSAWLRRSFEAIREQVGLQRK